MLSRTPSPRYYKEYLEETKKIVREEDQSNSMAEIVREIESHRCGQEEEERRNAPSRSFFARTVPHGDVG